MRRRDLILSGGTVLLSLAVNRSLMAQTTEGEAKMPTTPRDLTVVRTFDAAVTSVWQAWVDPDLVKRWWGPTGFTCPLAEMDFRVGGTSLVAMRSPEGNDIYTTWAYTKITPHRSFEYIFNLSDESGRKLDPTALGFPPDFPQDARHDVVFEALDGTRTRMTMTEYGYTNDQLFDLSKAGLEQTLDKMAALFAA